MKVPYRDKEKDRRWHKEAMKRRRAVAKRQVVTPSVTPIEHDIDGAPIYDE